MHDSVVHLATSKLSYNELAMLTILLGAILQRDPLDALLGAECPTCRDWAVAANAMSRWANVPPSRA